MSEDRKTESECAKMLAVKDHSQAIGEFIEWLGEQHIHLASYQLTYACDWRNGRTPKVEDDRRCVEGRVWNGPVNTGEPCGACAGRGYHTHRDPPLEPYRYTVNALLARYFGIDLAKVDEEQRAILAQLRGE